MSKNNFSCLFVSNLCYISDFNGHQSILCHWCCHSILIFLIVYAEVQLHEPVTLGLNQYCNKLYYRVTEIIKTFFSCQEYNQDNQLIPIQINYKRTLTFKFVLKLFFSEHFFIKNTSSCRGIESRIGVSDTSWRGIESRTRCLGHIKIYILSLDVFICVREKVRFCLQLVQC